MFESRCSAVLHVRDIHLQEVIAQHLRLLSSVEQKKHEEGKSDSENNMTQTIRGHKAANLDSVNI